MEAAAEEGEARVLRAVAAVMQKYFRAFRLEATLARIEQAMRE